MTSSKFSVYVALAADLGIAAIKFIAAAFTYSSAMMAEGIHSLIDSVNEVLLLIGIHKSKKPADADRPFGYGKELYFWSFMVSVLLFCLGGSVVFYQGIAHLRHPIPLRNLSWNYAVLAVSFIFNCFSIIPPLRLFNKERKGRSFWSSVRRSKDPSTFTVLLEDAGGLAGVVIAFLGIAFGHVLNNPYLDGIASLLIGLILVAISIFLAIESRSLLMGETPEKKTLAEIVQIAEGDPSVIKVIKHYSMYLSPDEIVLQLIASFKPGLSAKEIVEGIERIQYGIRQKFPHVKQIFIEPGTSRTAKRSSRHFPKS